MLSCAMLMECSSVARPQPTLFLIKIYHLSTEASDSNKNQSNVFVLAANKNKKHSRMINFLFCSVVDRN